MKSLIPVMSFVALLTLTSCAMLTSWKSIPPPGGCDQCHTVEISANWKVNYQPVTLSNERGQLSFQSPQYNTPIRQDQPTSPLDAKKVEEQPCFACHNAPTPAHKGRMGTFHH